MNVLDQPDHVTTDQTNIEGQGEENLRNTDSWKFKGKWNIFADVKASV